MAFLSSAPTDPEARAGLEDAGYNLFRRYFAGMISTWDIVFFALISFLLIANLYSRNPISQINRATRNNVVLLYFKVLSVSIVVGLVIIVFTQIDHVAPTDWFRPVVSILYLFLTYFLVVNVIQTKKDFNSFIRITERLAFALVVYGFIRLYYILSGELTTLVVEGMPIILYSELLYFDLPICIYFAYIWCGRKLGLSRILLLLLMIGFVLVSTRRFNYILLALNFILVLIVARKAKIITFGEAVARLKIISLIALFGFSVIVLTVPGLIDAVLFAIGTINMFSESGYEYTGEFRLVQIQNIFLNMLEHPFTLLSGFGIASKWYEFVELPTTIDVVGAHMAYDAKVVAPGSRWFPFFHVPYFSTFFRFGIIGSFLLLYVVYKLYQNYSMLIRRQDRDIQISLVALTVLVFMPILTIGDNTPPTFGIILGVYLGLLDAARFFPSTMVKS